MKIKILSDRNNNNPVLHEIISNDQVSVVDDIRDADIVAVFYTRDLVRTVEFLLSQWNHYAILIEMTTHCFSSDRVFMINTKLRDPSLAIYKNNLSRVDITHIDFSFVHFNLNLKAEVLNCLLLTGELIGWETFNKRLNLRFSYNDTSVHVSGYIRDLNFTLSIFISNTGVDYRETIKTYARHGDVFTIDNNNHDHTYGERYGVALQQVLFDIMNYKAARYYQYYSDLVVKRCLNISNNKPNR